MILYNYNYFKLNPLKFVNKMSEKVYNDTEEVKFLKE